jgi:hypothetical protein
MMRPLYGEWRAYEAAVAAAVARAPGHWLGNFALAHVRYQTGRFAEALAPIAAAAAAEPLCPSVRYGLAMVQWATGDLEASDATQRESLRRFPADWGLFQQRFSFLALTGRPGEARALGALGYRELPPDEMLPLSPARAAAALLALEFGGADRRATTVEGLVADRRAGAVATVEAAQWLAALGAPERALDILPGYYFGAAPIVSPAGDIARPGRFIHSYFLFLPPMAAVWPMSGFSTLLAEIGLEDFWRETGTRPDFRR